MKDKECLLIGTGLLERGGSAILVQHNLSNLHTAELNFKHNTLVSQLTPESIILYFSSII